MLDAICRRAFFQFELPLHFLARPPRIDGDLRDWPQECLLPPLIELEDQDAFADVYWGWNDDGLFFACHVHDCKGPPRADADAWWKNDGVRICVDTRDARDVKRATRFCHFFYVLPVGGGPGRKAPRVGIHKMSRAKEPPPRCDLSLIKAAAHIERSAYQLEVFIPAACLNGWDPAEHPRIGIFYKIKDAARGGQHLTVDDELGWNADPSTWATGVLTRPR